MTELLEQKFNNAKNTPSDVSEYIQILKNYASNCNHVTEFGVRWIVSTWGLLAGLPKIMVSYDINHPSVHGVRIEEVYDIAKDNNIDYSFILDSTLEVNIDQTDLLFIDTDHTYEHLKQELNIHHSKINKWIIFHDVVSFPNMTPAIFEFLEIHPEWIIEEHITTGNGLMIIKRK